MSEAPHPKYDTDTLISALLERVVALVSVGSRTAALALSELKLASSSAALAIAAAFALVLMFLGLWGILLTMGFFLLREAGFAAVWATGILALFQIAICLAIVALLYRLLQQMKFVNTRRALSERLVEDSSTDRTTEVLP